MTTPLTGPLLSAHREVDSARWQTTVRSALKKHRALVPTAEALGVSKRTLQRWISEVPQLVSGLSLPTVGWPKGRKRS